MKRVMVIGGGNWQVPIVRKAKAMGAFVVNSNLHPDSPGFAEADVGLVADVLDRNKNLEYAIEYSVDAIVTDQSDIAVPTAAYIAEALGLPGIGCDASDLFTNKYEMREFGLFHRFPTPRFRLCRTTSELTQFAEAVGFPLVVKPPANQSSRGVAKVTCKEQLSHALERASKQSRDGSVLVEEFIGGLEVTVDGIKLNGGEHYCLATSIKRPYPHNEMIASRLWFCQEDSRIDFASLHRQHNCLVEAMKIPFGLTHAEYKCHNGNFYLIEIAARGGGTKISSEIVPLMSGVDSNELLIRMALGEKVVELQPARKPRVAALDFFAFRSGRILSVRGTEQAREMEGVCEIDVSVSAGMCVRDAVDDRSRHGYVIAHADNSATLLSLLNRVHNLVQVEYA